MSALTFLAVSVNCKLKVTTEEVSFKRTVCLQKMLTKLFLLKIDKKLSDFDNIKKYFPWLQIY